MDDAATAPPFAPRVGQPAAHNDRIGVVLCFVGLTARMKWADGTMGYVRTAALTDPIPPATCTLAQALDFVERAEAHAAAEKGTRILTPLRVLRALAGAAKEARDARRTG